jgi:cell division protein ZapA
MARIEVELAGRSYGVACEEGQEARLREIAAFADSKMRALSSGRAYTSETQLLVLTMLTLADQVFDLRAELAKARTSAGVAPAADMAALEERYSTLIESLAKRVNSIAKKLATA